MKIHGANSKLVEYKLIFLFCHIMEEIMEINFP